MWRLKRFHACDEHLLFMSDLILFLDIDGVLHPWRREPIESFINSDKYRIAVRPEPVEGLRQAQPERFGVMIYENINRCWFQLKTGPTRPYPNQAGPMASNR